jgi:hypothetical protein
VIETHTRQLDEELAAAAAGTSADRRTAGGRAWPRRRFSTTDHRGSAYEERGPAVTKHRAQRRAAKMIRELRLLGYRVDPGRPPATTLGMIARVFRPWTEELKARVPVAR